MFDWTYAILILILTNQITGLLDEYNLLLAMFVSRYIKSKTTTYTTNENLLFSCL